METIKSYLKTAWDKVWAAVKSSPAVFGYGVVLGWNLGWIIGKVF